MTNNFLKFHHVTFSHETSPEHLFRDLTFHLSPGWTGVVGPNGAGKTTLLKLATGLMKPLSGNITIPPRSLYCAQRTDDAPDRFTGFNSSCDKSTNIIRGQLGIRADWIDRWHTLSHGERKRAQIAVALWLQPDVLAVDEPTNHVDAEARQLLNTALLAYPGIGLLVSHDRELLDSLCRQCIFIDPPDVAVRKGGYTKGKQAADDEQKTLRRQGAVKKRTYRKLKREAGIRRDIANQSDQRVSKKGIPKKDHAAKAKIDGARVSGKDGVGGKLLRQLDGRLSQAEKELSEIRIKKDNVMGIWLPGSRSQRDKLLDIPEGFLMLGNHRQLRYPGICLRPDDRVGITGRNGSGKSTLIAKAVAALNVPENRVTYIPQEIDLSKSQSILTEALELSNEQKGHLMTIVSRLGSRPRRLLDSNSPSPGEIRKLLLALGMTRAPYIIILDEPTNHMDLPSIEYLEQALSDCPCCLVLISHDMRFIDALTDKRWHITLESMDSYRLEIM